MLKRSLTGVISYLLIWSSVSFVSAINLFWVVIGDFQFPFFLFTLTGPVSLFFFRGKMILQAIRGFASPYFLSALAAS